MPWTVSAQSEDEARAASGGKLLLNDLRPLCEPRGWMTDHLIDYGVTAFPMDGGVRGDRYNGVYWIAPTIVTAAKDGAAGDFANTLGAALGGIAAHLDDTINIRIWPRDASVILFPINRDNRHWSLLAFYKADRTFAHFDSLPESNGAEATKLVNKLHAAGYLSRALPVDNVAVTRQQDGYNCGLFVVEFAHLIMDAGARPGDEHIPTVNSASCDQRREAMLRSLGLAVQNIPAQAAIAEGGGPESEEVKAEKKKELVEQIKKVEEQLASEEEGPIWLAGIKPCPLSEAAVVTVTMQSSEPAAHDFTAAHVVFTVGSEKFARKCVKDGKVWKVEAKFQATQAFDVGIEAFAHKGPCFEKATLTDVRKAVKAHDHLEVEFTFVARPDRTIYAQFMVEDENGPRPMPKDFAIELMLDHGEERLNVRVDEKGAVSAIVPWECSFIGISFPAAGRWMKVTWKPDSPAQSQASFQAATKEDEGQPLVIPPHSWDLNGDEWMVPEKIHGKGDAFKPHIDLSQPGALGTREEPLTYILLAAAKPSAGFKMNGKVIDHVVVLMLENRGFDHFLGYLYEGGEKPKNSYPPSPLGPHAGLRPFEGLDGVELNCPYDYNTAQHGATDDSWDPKNGVRLMGTVPVKKGARAANSPKVNPHEDFQHIFQDMYGKDIVTLPADMTDPALRKKAVQNADGSYKKAPMNGWVQNFCDGALHHMTAAKVKNPTLTHELVSEIMDAYVPGQLPVMSGLARQYGVSDMWFCSVPSQTNTNRSFWITGSAAGLVRNEFYPAHSIKSWAAGPEGIASDRLPAGGDDGMLHRRSLFDVLDEAKVSWKYYYTLYWPPKVGDIWPIDLCPQFEPKRKTHFPKIAQLYKDAAAGKLPAVSYVEPLWGGGKIWDTMDPTLRFAGNEFHPVSDTTYGEFFVKEVYDALFGMKEDGKTPRNPKADSTVLMITFDENGGTFDHLMPWKARPTGREPQVTQYDFKFDCYGVRVPTLLISKYVPPGTVFRSDSETPFDHASCLATILKWRGIPAWKWKLGDRVKFAPTFDGVLTHDGSAEAERQKSATGMRPFDKERAKIATSANALKYGDVFSLRYIGNKWPYDPEPNKPKDEDAFAGPRSDWLGGPESAKKWFYPVGTADPGLALKFKIKGGTAGQPVKCGTKLVLEITEGKAKGYTLGVPEVMGASCAYLTGGAQRDSKWIPWLWNDRTVGEPLYYGDEIFLHSERYEPERLTLYYDPYQRLSLDPWDQKHPGVKRWARFRAGEWDIWKIEKVVPTSLEVKPALTSTRFHPLADGKDGKPHVLKAELKLEFSVKPGEKDIDVYLRRSRANVEVYLDEAMTKPVEFGKNPVKLDAKIVTALLKGEKGEAVPLWVRATDGQYFLLNAAVARAKPSAAAVPGPSCTLQIGRAFSFLDGSSRWLQVVDTFDSVATVKGSMPRLRSLAALADMGTDELANFAIKRLFIRKGVLEQPVVIKIDGKPTPLMHPEAGAFQFPLHYSDFVIDRSGPKFLGALDADVAVEALVYKDFAISTLLAELKKRKNRGKDMAVSFDADLIQSVRDMARRRWEALRKEFPNNYADLDETEIEAATSVFAQKHMAQRKLSDFDLTARETSTLSRAIARELEKVTGGGIPEALALKIGWIAWSQGGSIDVSKVRAALAAPGDDAARAAAYEASCTGAAYEPKKEYKHGKYKGTGYYHLLIDEVGAIACGLLEDTIADVDAGYGLGIPYMGPQYLQKDGALAREPNPKKEEENRFEIGDIITDETSHYGSVFSHDKNIMDALRKLTDAGVVWSFARFDKNKNLRDNAREVIRKSGQAAIATAYFEREAFIDAILMFEQVSKKEAQAQLFKAEFKNGKTADDKKKAAGKLMGNISDVGQFLYGVGLSALMAQAANDDARLKKMEALKEVVKLSCLVAFPRWSVFANTLDNVKDTADGITAEMFAESINSRSYAHKKMAPGELDPEAPRMHVEWVSIDDKIAGQRLADFNDEMKAVWDFIREQKKYFEATDHMIVGLRAFQERFDPKPGRQAVRAELDTILGKLPNLSTFLPGGDRDALLDALALQVEESVRFQVKRAPTVKPPGAKEPEAPKPAEEKRYSCQKCKNELKFEVKMQRADTCPHCGADLHVCKNCEHWDISANNQCKAAIADYIPDREKANLCTFFEFKAGAPATAPKANPKLDALFKKK